MCQPLLPPSQQKGCSEQDGLSVWLSWVPQGYFSREGPVVSPLTSAGFCNADVR